MIKTLPRLNPIINQRTSDSAVEWFFFLPYLSIPFLQSARNNLNEYFYCQIGKFVQCKTVQWKIQFDTTFNTETTSISNTYFDRLLTRVQISFQNNFCSTCNVVGDTVPNTDGDVFLLDVQYQNITTTVPFWKT